MGCRSVSGPFSVDWLAVITSTTSGTTLRFGKIAREMKLSQNIRFPAQKKIFFLFLTVTHICQFQINERAL